MAIQTFKGPMTIPPLPMQVGNAPNFAALTLDAASEKIGAIVVAPRTGNIAKFGYTTNIVTTGATMDGRIETLTGTVPAVPSGTLWGTNTNGSSVIADTDDNVSKEVTLTAVAAVTQGQLIAIVLSNPAVSFGNLGINTFSDENPHLPYSLHYTGSWAVATFRSPCLWVEYDDGAVYPVAGCYPFHVITTVALSTSSTPDVVGMRFQLPFPARVIGAWAYIELDGSADIKLVSTAYNQGAGTGILASKTLDTAQRVSAGPGVMFVYFSSSYDISANTDYRLIIEPTTTTNMNVYYGACNSVKQMDGYPGGQLWPYTSAKDPTGDGSWTNYNNGTDGYRRLISGLLFEGFGDDAGGAGGMLGRNPGMTGGMV